MGKWTVAGSSHRAQGDRVREWRQSGGTFSQTSNGPASLLTRVWLVATACPSPGVFHSSAPSSRLCPRRPRRPPPSAKQHNGHRTHHRKAQEALLARPHHRARHWHERRLRILVSCCRIPLSHLSSPPRYRYGVHLKRGEHPVFLVDPPPRCSAHVSPPQSIVCSLVDFLLCVPYSPAPGGVLPEAREGQAGRTVDLDTSCILLAIQSLSFFLPPTQRWP